MLSLLWLVGLLAATVYGQAGTYTDAKTGIKFWELSVSAAQAGTNGLKMGFALPATTQSGYQDEYIGHIVSGLSTTGSWAGLSHSSGMTNSLLLAFWPNGASVQGSFRWATGYVSPEIYTGNATYTTISSSVNSTHFEIIYRCMHCWVWQQDGVSGSQIPPTAAGGNLVFGWVKHTATPATPADPEAYLDQHAYYNIAVQPAASMRDTAYTSWISKGGSSTTRTATATTTTAAPTTTAPAACAASQTAGTDTYDYIVAGAGAGGIPIAAKLAEAGKKVLLVEKGPPSSGRWGGTIKPKWLEGTNLTRFDVPGLCNQIWVDSEGIACRDASSMAGCVLGGGTAINAGLWWKPNPADFDENFPSGWKSGDMNGAISRVFQKIPGTYVPSMDGKTYLRAGFNALAAALSSASWASVDANAQPGNKQKVYSQTPYMFSNGERGGPMATYLVEASKRSNFKLLTNTGVRRIVRTGGKATGVELEAQTADGKCGTVKLSATGRVIVSAGVFGSSKILMRSGIGPTDQLNIVKASATDGASMIASSSWINLPVGKNLDDHTNTDVVIDNKDAQFYDFYQAYTDPIPSDKTAYLTKRSGILAQAAPNIGPVFWEVITASDRSQRQLQWTARVEGGHDITANTSMVLSQYLGRGKTSRGRITITPSLSMTVSELPFVNTAGDVAAIVQGIKNLKDIVAKSPKLTMKYPTATESVEDFVANYPNSVGSRTANHWVGTAKMGTDSGLSGGTSVVDTNTKVYGTDNIFVVDASVFPGMVTTNPSSLIMAVAERASERILAL